MNKPWSQDFNPRRDGEHPADFLQREVALLEKLGADGKPTRSITITSREARTLLALIDQQPAGVIVTDAGIAKLGELMDEWRMRIQVLSEEVNAHGAIASIVDRDRLKACADEVAALVAAAPTKGGAA